MEVASSAGFNHINTFVHPQATFVDASGEEEAWFLKGVKDRAIPLGRTVIDLPENAEKNLMWITLLDSASLSGMLNLLWVDDSCGCADSRVHHNSVNIPFKWSLNRGSFISGSSQSCLNCGPL